MVTGTMAYFDNDAGFTETFNQSARLYGTVLRNNFFTRLPAWQARTLRAELSKPGSPHIHRSKKVVKFLVNVAGRLITNAKPPDQSRYKSEEIKQYDQTSDVYLQEIVKRHRSQLTEALLLEQ